MNYYVGVDLGGTEIKAGVVSADGGIICRGMAPTDSKRGYKDVIGDIAALIKRVIKESRIEEKSIKSIGIGVPGTCDTERGLVIYAANIGFENVQIGEEMLKYFDLPVFVGNDANCAALGEFYALDGNVSDMVFITLGTGIGGGIIINKHLYTGKNSTAAEVGHMIIVDEGLSCACGARGCWESYASVSALIRMTKEYAEAHPESQIAKECKNGVSGKTAFQLAKDGDKGGREIVDKWIWYLSVGVISLINIFQPQYLVIGGAISREGEYILAPLRKYQSMNRYSGIENGTEILQAKLGNDAGLIGSAFLGKGEE